MILKVLKIGESLKNKPLKTAKDAYKFMRFLNQEDRENFYVLHLNVKNSIIAKELISIGTLTNALVHPREVFKAAILNNSHRIICVHNHPSGDPDPSQDDIKIAKRLNKTGSIIGIPVIDHIIIGHKRYVSIMDRC